MHTSDVLIIGCGIAGATAALTLAKNTAAVSSLIYIFPFLSLLLIHYVLGEPVFPSTLIGLVLIVAGVLLSRFSDSTKSRTFTR